jgi:cytosine/adenosine deaminase-related metal-dependent hydrolase
MDVLLKNVTFNQASQNVMVDVNISGKHIRDVGQNLINHKASLILDCSGYFLYPGLINSHDHLEMNLYGKMGSPPYNNYVEWARDIYKPESDEITRIEKTDIKDRLLWGGFKNLISGCTTVVHHNPWHKMFDNVSFPVKVLKDFTWAHSLAFEKNIAEKMADSNFPFIIHAGEGIDELAAQEIITLAEIGLLNQHTVLVHATALNQKTAALVQKQDASIIWCPQSNHFMFGKTLSLQKANGIRIALGTDSTMTGSPTLLQEMSVAHKVSGEDAQMLFDMVTASPAAMFKIDKPKIEVGGVADLFLAPMKISDYFQNLLLISSQDISCVVLDGAIRLADKAIIDNTGIKQVKHLSERFYLHGIEKYTDVPIGKLKKKFRAAMGEQVLSRNELWGLIEA